MLFTLTCLLPIRLVHAKLSKALEQVHGMHAGTERDCTRACSSRTRGRDDAGRSLMLGTVHVSVCR